jgi:hypothetical protein
VLTRQSVRTRPLAKVPVFQVFFDENVWEKVAYVCG